MDKRRELRDTEFRLEVAEQKQRQAENLVKLLRAKRLRLRKEMGLEPEPDQLPFGQEHDHPHTNKHWDM